MLAYQPIAFLMGKSPIDLFVHGGPIMWPILLVSFVAVTVVLERIAFLLKENSTREPELAAKMLEHIENGKIDAALGLGTPSHDYIARILVYTLSHPEEARTSSFARAANNEMQRFQQGLPILDTCITASPLLGLLGTVAGMMATFGALGEGDIGASAGKITGGVGEALIATACGLVVAIIGLFPFNVLNSRIEKARHDISDAANALDVAIKKDEKRAALAAAR
jgi:biopolymer transport protein ExbB